MCMEDFLPDTSNCGLRMHRECRERFLHHRLQRKPPISDPSMHHVTCVTHAPWCMSRSLTRGGGENVPGIPSVFTTHNCTYLTRDCLPTLFDLRLTGEACTLIASYLFKWKQRVNIGNVKSEWGEISKGVPQGSILGPLIFNIFLTDLFYFIKQGNMYNYADGNSV